jgi:hypothetical protein
MWSQTALAQVIEHRSPGLGGLSTHALDREQSLAILADADRLNRTRTMVPQGLSAQLALR